jgi:hypothetical protein
VTAKDGKRWERHDNNMMLIKFHCKAVEVKQNKGEKKTKKKLWQLSIIERFISITFEFG